MAIGTLPSQDAAVSFVARKPHVVDSGICHVDFKRVRVALKGGVLIPNGFTTTLK